MGKFFVWEIQKSCLEDLKINQGINQGLKVFKISSSWYLWPDQCQKIRVAGQIIENIFSTSVDIKLSLSQKWVLVLF